MELRDVLAGGGGWTAARRAKSVWAAAGLIVLLAAGAAVVLADPNSPITVTKIDSPDPVASGSELTYTITIVNTAGSKLTNFTLSDQINGVGGIGVPPQLVLTSTRGSCSQNVNNLVTCSGGEIEGGGSWTVTIRGIVTAANGTTLNNTASVTATRSAQNFTTTATATTLVSNGGGSTLPDLSISKTGPTTVSVGEPMAYVLTVNNTGTANAMNVKVVDTLPAGVNFVSTNPTSLFVCTPAVPTPSPVTVECTGGAVNQGTNATITINATAPAAPTTVTNTASVDPDNAIQEGNELNNTSALVNTSVITGPTPPVYGFSIDKTDVDSGASWDDGAGPDPVRPGQNVTYQILVTNTSPSGANNRADDVVVVDGTQGLEAASIQVNQIITNGVVGNGNGCVVIAPQVRCSIRSLDPGGTMLVTITGQVVGSAGSSIFNTATVTGNIKNEGHSATDSETTTVRPGVDLTITKAGSPNPVCARSWPTNTAASYPPPAAAVGVPPTPPLLGPAVCLGGLTYDFVIGNSGLDLASGVVLRDPLPPGTVFHRFDDLDGAGFTCGPPDASNVLQCTGGAIPTASTRRVRIVLIAPPTTGTITNTVTVDPVNAIFEGDETNNMATYVTEVVTGIDLAVAKYDTVDTTPDVPPLVLEGFDPIATNGTQTYTIEVDNLGPQDVTGVRIHDALPAGTIFRSAQEVGPSHGFTCSHSGGVVDCQGGALKGTANEFYFQPPPGNDRAVIRIRVFAQGIIGVMHNEVRVDPFNQIPEVNELNNIAVQDTEVQTGGAGMGAFNELTIEKTQTDPDPTNTARNAIVTYKIEIKNDGTDPVSDIIVRDFLPAGARYIEATGDPASEFNCSQQEGYIECRGGRLPAAAGMPPVPVGSAIITVKAFAPDTPGTYTNQAIVDPDHLIPEGNEFNNQDSAETVVKNGGAGAFNDLRIDKDGDATTTPGGSIVYTLKVWNEGSDPALNVSVSDTLPAGTTFVHAKDTVPGSPGAFTCTESGGVVDCTGATLAAGAPGAPRFIEIKVTAPNENITLTNQAFVDKLNAIPEGDELNNTDTFVTTVQSIINLKITKTGPNSSSQSQTTDYVVTVKNEKPMSGDGAPAFDVQMRDPLPVGLIPLAVDTGTGNNWACQVSQNPINLVECVGDLNPDQEVTIKITVFMTAEGGRSLDNEACVDPNDLIEEFSPPGETDNCSTKTLLVGEKPKLAPDVLISKNVDKTLATAGDSLDYTIVVANAGTAKAKTPVKITDTLPGSVTPVGSPVTTNGWTCTLVASTVECQDPGTGLDPGASIQITLNTVINAGVTAPISNTAKTVDPILVDPGADPNVEYVDEVNTTNNSSTVATSISGAPFDLVLTSITDAPDPVSTGKPLKYTVVATNSGTEGKNAVQIQIEVPVVGALFQSADGSNGFNCTIPSPLNSPFSFTCVGDMPAGGSTTVLVNVVATGPAGADLKLKATIDPANAFSNEAEEGNNVKEETTTVSGSVCVGCVDLVASQLVASPDPATAGGAVTFTFVVVNVGDLPSTLAPTEPLAFFDLSASGTFNFMSRSSSDPAVSCTPDPPINGITALISDCFGNLAPGQGVTLSITVNALTAGTITAVGTLDPVDLVAEPAPDGENNNHLENSVVIN